MFFFLISIYAIDEHVLYSIKPVKFPTRILTLKDRKITFDEAVTFKKSLNTRIDTLHVKYVSNSKYNLVFSNGIYVCHEKTSNYNIYGCEEEDPNNEWTITEKSNDKFSIDHSNACITLSLDENGEIVAKGSECKNLESQLFVFEMARNNRKNKEDEDVLEKILAKGRNCKINDESDKIEDVKKTNEEYQKPDIKKKALDEIKKVDEGLPELNEKETETVCPSLVW